ncbi:hypothetical protein [Sorangium sp. So ce117]|uniref:hypothetical protein n=1 Tax=Sorangium sp. So ce117 TaxID=3133277 RepID=UPI003F5D7189
MLKKIMAGALMAAGVSVAFGAYASPTDTAIDWRMDAFVGVYRHQADGNVSINFKSTPSSTTFINSFPGSGGTDICGGTTTLILNSGLPGFQDIVRSISAAGISGKKVKIGYDEYSGVCYLKEFTVFM